VDTFTTLWNRILLRVPALGPDLAQDLIRDAFNQLCERREWSWLTRTNSFYIPVIVTGGTVSTTSGSPIVTGSGTAFTGSMIGRQWRIAVNYPTYTILQVVSPTSLVLDRAWNGPALSGYSYQIFQSYYSVPNDFQYFIVVTNPTNNYRLNHLASQSELNSHDPQRAQFGIAYACAFYDYSQSQIGIISETVRVRGSGSVPVSTTTLGYSYPIDSLYSLEITSGGAVGAAQYKWSQDGSVQGTGIVSQSDPFDLSNGVQVYFPDGIYELGDVFVIQCNAQSVAGVPRYELWPRPADNAVYPFQYISRIPELSDAQPQLPPPFSRRGDVVLEMAMTNAALWPGSEASPNTYRDPGVSNAHRVTAERMIYELEKKDDETAIKDLSYSGLPFMGPWHDGSWLQTHAIYNP
jgi:hypothetical protein